LKGFGIPYKWANQTWFFPERIVSEYEWKEGLKFYYPELKALPASGAAIKLVFIHAVVKKINPEYSEDQIENNWKSWNINQDYSADTPLNRRTVSILTDKILNPFEIEITLNGEMVE
jgi:hypothetical protein